MVRILCKYVLFVLTQGSFDGILIDMGVSVAQWEDRERGFCPTRNGLLDLRLDSDLEPTKPTGSEVLQHLQEQRLWKLLKEYGGMKQRARYAALAVAEARYMFQKFQTTHVRRPRRQLDMRKLKIV